MNIKKEPFFNIKYKQFVNDNLLDLNYIKELTKNISIYRPVQSDNLNKVKKYGLAKTRKQLKKWKINYHKLVMGKPSYDYFVDYKAIGFKKNWMLNFKSILKIRIIYREKL
jgi:hypothetical protein